VKDEDREVHLEADIPAPSSAPAPDSWISDPNEDGQWAQGPQEASREGSQSPDGVAAPISDERLRTRQDFQLLFDQNRSFRGTYLVLLTRSNGLDRARCAFVASKRTGGAVVRNRCRRILREAYRQVRPQALIRGWDIALIARPPCKNAFSRDIVEELVKLYAEAGLLRTPPLRDAEPRVV
jgi:ribonuclease P protein component